MSILPLHEEVQEPKHRPQNNPSEKTKEHDSAALKDIEGGYMEIK